MSLKPHGIEPIPEETARVAKSAFPHGNVYLRVRDELGTLFDDATFSSLFSRRGQPAQAPWRLALVVLFQFVENLSDEQAVEALRARIDWKYALGLTLADAGFDSSVLSEFRTRLVKGSVEHVFLDALIEKARDRKWIKAQGRQRTDSTHVLGAIRALNRLECVVETLRCALNSLADAAPDWVRSHARPEWVDRYGPRADDYRLPKKDYARRSYAEQVGADGFVILKAVHEEESSRWLAKIAAVETLRRVWIQQFTISADAVRWRTSENGLPPSLLFLSSPYDREAHYAKKRSTSWVGYKVHVTEACDPDAPHLITHVETTAAPVADSDLTAPIQLALVAKDLSPKTHLVDTGYVTADLLVSSERRHGITLMGPARGDSHRQARERKGLAASEFEVDWDKQQACCPAGCISSSWTAVHDARGRPKIKIKFAGADCLGCARQQDCTSSKRVRRTLTLPESGEYMRLRSAREEQNRPSFAAEYAQRAGIEGTISQAVRSFGLRRCRYIGKSKTHLQHVLTAAAINFIRIGCWLAGDPHAKTRRSRFQAAMQAAT